MTTPYTQTPAGLAYMARFNRQPAWRPAVPCKVCPTCNQLRAVTYFHAKDGGTQHQCKACQSDMDRERRLRKQAGMPPPTPDKQCSRCHAELPATAFRYAGATGKIRSFDHCQGCHQKRAGKPSRRYERIDGVMHTFCRCCERMLPETDFRVKLDVRSTVQRASWCKRCDGEWRQVSPAREVA